MILLGIHGFVATVRPDANLGRILAAYGGAVVAGSPAGGWSWTASGPTRFDLAGALICLVGLAVILYSPRAA